VIRLFVGIELPETVRERLQGMAGGIPGARWVAPANLHLTLRFLGEVEDPVLPEIERALAAIRAEPFEITLSGIDVFGSKRKPRLLMANIERSRGLRHLRDKVESALKRIGFEAEERRFTPHVTMARFSNARYSRICRFLEANGMFRAGPFAVDRFVLFSSLLTKAGPVYRQEAAYPLHTP
jgi:2'-5' RNA ligase